MDRASAFYRLFVFGTLLCLSLTPGCGGGNGDNGRATGSVEIVRGQTLRVGQRKDLAIIVRDADGNRVIPERRDIVLTIVSGDDKIRIVGGPQVDGIRPGTATLTATVNGIESSETTVTVFDL